VRELVARCRRGDARAERELLELVLPAVRGVARTMLGQASDADDAVQLALLDVLAGLDAYRGEGRIVAWARTIAVRASLRVAAANRRHVSVADPEFVAPTVDAPDDSPIEGLAKPLSVYLDQLPPVQRHALVLRHGLGYSVPEIAAMTGESVNTIKSRLLQGRKEIRRLLRREETVADIRRQREGRGS
jgi:RNA polymerase sigma factor (sigma-70 family)